MNFTAQAYQSLFPYTLVPEDSANVRYGSLEPLKDNLLVELGLIGRRVNNGVTKQFGILRGSSVEMRRETVLLSREVWF
jgi:hypothetical protein